MGHGILFVPLHEDQNKTAGVPIAVFRAALSRANIELPDMPDGSYSLDAFVNDMSNLIVTGGQVLSFGIHRPSAENMKLWLELIKVGFAMIPDNGEAFVSAALLEKTPYLNDKNLFPEGVKVVSKLKDF